MALSNAEGDAAAERLERRWFAAFKAASVARSECEALLDQMERIETAWHHARVRLANLEMLRDELGDELAGLDAAVDARSVSEDAEIVSAA